MYRISFFLLTLPALWGQGLVESAVLTGSSTAAAGKGGRGIGTALSRTLGAVAGVAGSGAKSSTTAGKAAIPRSDVIRAEERKELPDASLLKVGMVREEIERIAGKPTQVMSLPDGGKLVERYKYIAGKQELRLVLEDGKLSEIKPQR